MRIELELSIDMELGEIGLERTCVYRCMYSRCIYMRRLPDCRYLNKFGGVRAA